MKRGLSQFEQDHNSLQMDNHFAHLRTLYAIVLQFLNSVQFDRQPLNIIRNGFPQHSCFWRDETDNSARRNSLCSDKNKH
jgi:hypothetical protein